ncbi:MAG: hypothetical protein HKL79_03665 [Thermoplasmata archaeon]|nr:hypothetical protein [Thermoplasmata archaeon]
MIAKTPGLAEILKTDWQRAARFYARFGVTEEMVRRGVPDAGADGGDLYRSEVSRSLRVICLRRTIAAVAERDRAFG